MGLARFLVMLIAGAGAFCALGLAITAAIPNADAAQPDARHRRPGARFRDVRKRANGSLSCRTAGPGSGRLLGHFVRRLEQDR